MFLTKAINVNIQEENLIKMFLEIEFIGKLMKHQFRGKFKEIKLNLENSEAGQIDLKSLFYSGRQW